MLSDEQIEQYMRLVSVLHKVGKIADADREIFEDVLAELRSLRTREYREPTAEDDRAWVWLESEYNTSPAYLTQDKHYKTGVMEWRISQGTSHRKLDKGTRVCPVVPKPKPQVATGN